MDAKEELYLEYARCINMCKGTDVKSWECVRLSTTPERSMVSPYHPDFNLDPECYKFAIFILEGKPVFPGDILYLGSDVRKCEVCVGGYRIENDRLTDLFASEDWHRYVPGVKCGWSWNPPKEHEYIINAQFAWNPLVQKKTFAVNGVELPYPINNGPVVNNIITIRSNKYSSFFEFQCDDDADSFALELIKILRTASEERRSHESNSGKIN